MDQSEWEDLLHDLTSDILTADEKSDQRYKAGRAYGKAGRGAGECQSQSCQPGSSREWRRAMTISNIRYSTLGKIKFDCEGITFSIAEPSDGTILVGTNPALAAKWIRSHYSYLLEQFQADGKGSE